MKHPIYMTEDIQCLNEKADRLLALSRVGIAASDSAMNLDLGDCGYCGLFEAMALISADLSDELMQRETFGKAPKQAPKPCDPDINTAKAFLSGHAAGLGLTPPAPLVDKTGAPSGPLLRYCKEYGVSLDRLFASDPPKEQIQ